MGAWNTKIKGNDTFQDIYQQFFDLYNEGHNPAHVSKQIQKDFAEMFDDYDDRNNSLFGLALAQWETKSLDAYIFKQVKEIIESGNDLKVWKGLGADEKSILKRKKELEKFLTQLSTERDRPKRRVRPKFEFEMINLVSAVAPDNQKNFHVNEEYTNNIYVHTSGIMMWNSGGGGSVLYFSGQGKNIRAKWLDSKTLEVTHDKDIVFTMKQESARYYNDEVAVIYKSE
ncbi:hypothetical protein HRG84_05575 [Flavisolibacter sp. BT320]|nr:hypothetical protein [Flavisolibacter longurius]